MIALQVISLQLRRVQDAHGIERGQPEVLQGDEGGEVRQRGERRAGAEIGKQIGFQLRLIA